MRLDGSSTLFSPQQPDADWLREERNYGPDHRFAYDNEHPRRCRKCGKADESHR